MRIVKIELEEQVDGRLNRVARTFPLLEIQKMTQATAGYGFLEIVKQLNTALDKPRAVVPPAPAAAAPVAARDATEGVAKIKLPGKKQLAAK